MHTSRWITSGAVVAVVLACLLAAMTLTGAASQAVVSPVSHSGASAADAIAAISSTAVARGAAPGSYLVLGWNDLGMHCYNNDFSDMAILPPYNTLWAQVVQVGDSPQIITSGITVEYSFPDNSYSVGKTNFWDYAQKLFGVNLAPNVGLTGIGLSGTMSLVSDHFQATGIPLTEYRDQDLSNRYPYQTALIVVRDATSGVELARNTVVAPVSTEMSCENCHSDDGDATTTYPITPTGSIATNILTLHDYLSMDSYPAGHTGPLMDPARRPVLCAECHSSNALAAPGVSGVSSVSSAMHRHHASLPDITPDVDGCYNCHPGPATQCLRDVMSQDMGMQCQNCHGDMLHIAQNPNPWLNEPRCDSPACHGAGYQLSNALYRFSQGHGELYCASCHDSTHAIAPSREANDAIKFINLQGHAGTLRSCTVCHATQPTGTFRHTLMPQSSVSDIYLPVVGVGDGAQ